MAWTYLFLAVCCLGGAVFYILQTRGTYDWERRIGHGLITLAFIGAVVFGYKFVTGAPVPTPDPYAATMCGAGPYQYDC